MLLWTILLLTTARLCRGFFPVLKRGFRGNRHPFILGEDADARRSFALSMDIVVHDSDELDEDENDNPTLDEEEKENRKVELLSKPQFFDYRVKVIQTMEEDGELVLQPFYQRGYKWTQKQASLWIESIIRGYPCLPEIILLESTGTCNTQLSTGNSD